MKDVEDLQKKETKSVWNTIDFKEVPKVKELDSKKKSKPAPKKK